jgi:hypothetical protein
MRIVFAAGLGLGLASPPVAASETVARPTVERQLPATTSSAPLDVPEMRTRTSQTFRAAGGSYETRVSTESVNYRDGGGRWQRIDNRLRADGATLRNTANRYNLSIPSDLARGAVQVTTGDAWISFTPRGAEGTARSEGSRASFARAWPGVTLRYAATGDTVREELVMNDPSAVRDFNFEVRVPLGFTLEQRDSGAVLVLDRTGAVRFSLAPSTMVDAAGAFHRTPSELRRTVTGWTLTLRPDREWLAQTTRAWPITIDPQVAVNRDLACSITYENGIEGGACGDVLPVGEWCEPVGMCFRHRVLARFDVAAALPTGAHVEFATLVDETEAPLPPAYQMLTDWDANATWTNSAWNIPWTQPGAEDDHASSPVGDPTVLVRDWASGAATNFGVLFKHETSSEDIRYIDPQLALQWAPIEDPDGSTQEAAAEAYVADASITSAEARRRLSLQDRLNNFIDELAAAIAPQDFGGTWVDDSDGGSIKIGIETDQATPPQSKTEDAQFVLDAHAFADADFVAVDESLTDLESALNSLSDDIGELIDDGKAGIALSQRHNRLNVERVADLSSAEHQTLSTAIANAGVDVNVDVVPASELDNDGGEATCMRIFNVTYLACDLPPYRGGTHIVGHINCTGGFLARSQLDGLLYLLTAGHCVENKSNYNLISDPWVTYTKSGSSRRIGNAHKGTKEINEHYRIDAGLITVDPPTSSTPSQAWTPGNDRYIFVTPSENSGPDTTRDEFYEITKTSPPIISDESYYCVTGAPKFANGKHTVCGRIRSTQHRVKQRGYPSGVRFSSLMRIDMCGPGAGSSGGPLYKNNTGFGIFVIYSFTSCKKYFTPIKIAEDAMNVHVVPPG